MGLEIRKTDGRDKDFAELIKQLDDDLYGRYGELQKQYDGHNTTIDIEDAVVVYKDTVPVACGAFKRHGGDSAELKRIFVAKEHRRQGLSKTVVRELEELARSKGYRYAVLETGIKQHEAVALYKACGYAAIENFGPYVGNGNSICMKKSL
jgi:putative acetyltransferase